MTQVKVKANLPAINKRIQDTFKLVKRNKEAHQLAGEIVEKRIQAEARAGRPLNRERSFPDLKPSTIANRDYLSTLNQTQRTFLASRSNLTLTGQLIDAILYELEQDSGLYKILIEVVDSKRVPYNTGPNSRQQNPPDNKELAEILAKRGFVLFDGDVVANDDALRKRVSTVFRRALRRAIAVNNKVNK